MFDDEMERIPCEIIRGGTSKGIYILGNDLPEDKEKRDKVILSIFGSPDLRQIDGLGGADPLTSKLAIVAHSQRADADVDYTFGQVEIGNPIVDYSSNCGNISSGVGPFAINHNLVKAVEPVTTVRIYNTNTKRVFAAEIPVRNGHPVETGTYKVDGVPGTGARIGINMAGTIGAKTGSLLPTGNVRDMIEVEEIGKLEVSMVDAASPMVFVRAKDLGLSGIETPKEIDGNQKMLNILEDIRTTASVMMGIAPNKKIAHENIKAVPMVAFVSPPQSYQSHITGETIHPDTIDFVSRDMFMGIMHKTYSGTASVCTGCAAVTEGTIVNEVMEKIVTQGLIRIGHPGGVLECDMNVEDGKITKAAYGRTARRIMKGYVYVPHSLFVKSV